MNEITALMLLASLTIVLACVVGYWKRYRNTRLMANTYNPPNAGRNSDGIKTMLADAAITRGMFVKFGTNEDHVAKTAGATDVPMGIALDDALAAEDPIAVAILGACKGTQLVIAGAAVAVGAHVQATTGGLAITLASTGFRAGLALQASLASGDVIEIAPCLAESLAKA